MAMKIFVGADHAGFGLKEAVIPFLRELGYEVEDKGAFEYNEEDDYPDFVAPVAREVSTRPESVRGIVFGGSGQGEAIVANRFKHVRAVVYYGKSECVVSDKESVLSRSREHNDANILSIGARYITEEEMKRAVSEWLRLPFPGEERHKRRILKIERLNV